MTLSAILWDYDGTLVDSTQKNMAVTIEILKKFIPDIQKTPPTVLTSTDEYRNANFKYKNWREMYKYCYHLSEKQIDEAGQLWSSYQLKNQMTPNLFPGLKDAIQALVSIKLGICSQNCGITIRKALNEFGLSSYFKAIIGYEEVSWAEQKPNPAGFLKCLMTLNVPLQNTTIISIGDHQEDVTFGKSAERLLKNNGFEATVKCVAVDYSGSKPLNWKLKPDFIASSAGDIKAIIDNFRA
jgi:HAD superfamily hydrolase (TIGR01549 family)